MAKKIGKGKIITELVKGSLEYTLEWISSQFRKQFPYMDEGPYYRVEDSFADYVVVSSYSSDSGLMPSEFFMVTYTKSGDEYTFAARDQWEVVEYAYQPQTTLTPAPLPMGEGRKRKGRKFEERLNGHIFLEEREDGKARRIKIEGAMTAGVVNGNHRRYSAPVVSAAIAELRGHLHESNGQGMAVQVLGEAEHPSDKGGRANFLETVVKWNDVTFDGQRVDVIGHVLETAKGKDILTLMEGGVMPGVSLRGYGDGKNVTENGEKIFEVNELHITGFDLVLEPSFENSAALIESINQNGDEEMTLEQLLQLMRDNPEAFAGITEAQLKKMGAEQLKTLEEQVRTALGIGAGENITEALKSLKEKAGKFDESLKKSEVETAITEGTKELPYGKEGNENFVEAVKAASLADAAMVKTFIESKRKEYDKIYSKRELAKKGFGGTGLQVIGDVLETETGTPSYARASFELAESYRNRNGLQRFDHKAPVTPNERFTKLVLERFDKLYMNYVDARNVNRGLLTESRMFEEAELSTDLNLPTSVSRAIFDIVGPTLVGASIFDVGVIDQSPSRLNFKRFSGETGYAATATNEVVTGGAEGVWYPLAHGRLVPGTATVTSNPAGTTYMLNTDYVLDHAAGRIKFLAAGSIDTNDVLVTYQYKAIRDGEMQPIQRAKVTLDSMIITAAADRLADQISREAIVFGRSQLGFETVTETMAALVQETHRIIDEGLLYTAYSAVNSVANNSTDAWVVGTAQDDLDELVRLMGAAGIIIDDRYYPADFYLASNVNAERLSHWDGYRRDGFSNAVLNAAGFAGGVNNKPIFSSTEFPDSLIIAGNKQLVMYRVFQPMLIKGPFQTYDTSGAVSKLIAAEEYYTEEFNVTESPINEKGAFVPIVESGS